MAGPYQNVIMGISGPQGSGKSTVLTALGKVAHNQGLKLYSTYHVHYGPNKAVKDYIPIGSLDDIKYMRGGPHGAVWLGDELYQWIFSRSSQSDINKQLGMILMMARKRGISIFYTCHHPMHIDVMLRRVTNKWMFPHIYPVRQLDRDKISGYAHRFGVSDTVAYRYFRRELKADPSRWMIRCTIFNDYGQRTGTFNLRNLPYWFGCFDTREEINPLDTLGKAEYIRERGMEREMLFEQLLVSLGFTVFRVEHSGKGMGTHADLFVWHPDEPGVCYLVNVCGLSKTGNTVRINKTGIALKQLLDESKGVSRYDKLPDDIRHRVAQSSVKRAVIAFYPYRGDNWYYFIVDECGYYLDLIGDIAVSHRFKQVIKPFESRFV